MTSTIGKGGTRVGLAARTRAFIEDGMFDFGHDEVIDLAEVEGGGGVEGERLEL